MRSHINSMSIANIEREQFNFKFDTATEGDLKQINAIDNRSEEHAEMLKLQKEGAGKLLVARNGPEIAGYVFVYYNHQSAHFPEVRAPFLEDLIVHPNFRKKGLGKGLLRKCEEEVKNHGGQELTFAVLASNQQAINFYTENSYAEIPDMEFEPPKQGDGKKEIGYYFRKKLT